MSLVQIDLNPGAKQLRVFGLSGLAASVILAAVLLFVWHVALVWALLALGAGCAILLCSLISRRAARVLYVVLTVAALPIGFVVSFVLLAAFYFLLLTPVGLFFRIIGRDPLRRRFDRLGDTYWIPHRPAAGPERYFHQF